MRTIAAAPDFASLARQRGVTLVELMVAMVIGLFLVVVVGTVFLGSKQMYLTQDANARLQENARYAVEFFSRQLRSAGYDLIDFNPLSGSLYSVPSGTSFTGTALAGTDGGGSVSDTLTVSFSSPVDCLGNATPSGTAINLIRLNVSNQLECLGNGNPAAQPILDEVEDLQIRYGQAIGGNFGYVTAASANMGIVTSVRLCLLLRASADANKNYTDQQQSYVDCLGVTQTAADRRIRRAVTTTITLRNRNP